MLHGSMIEAEAVRMLWEHEVYRRLRDVLKQVKFMESLVRALLAAQPLAELVWLHVT